MKATTPWLGSALVAALAVSAAAAQCPGGHGIRQAPDACGPGYYAPNEYGLWFGPNYDLHPPCQPFNGMVFGPGGPGGPGGKNGSEVPGAPGGPYGPGAAGGPAGPYGPYGPRAAYPQVPGGPYALNTPGRPGGYGALGGRGVPPNPYSGPRGNEGLQGSGAPSQLGPNNGFRFSFNGGAPTGPGNQGGPYGPYAAYGPGGRMVPYPCGDGEFGQEVPGPASFPTHPWARSPRDFFMAD